VKIELERMLPDWSGPRWFNLGAPAVWVRGLTRRPVIVWLWDCFNRHTADGAHFWGVGLLNVNGRCLLYVGHDHADVAFVRVWRA
jgi:hypothetical protein